MWAVRAVGVTAAVVVAVVVLVVLVITCKEGGGEGRS